MADLGGTNTRFALVDRRGRLQASKTYPAAAFHSVDEALARYLRDVAPGAAPPAAVLAIAGQVTDGRARFSNLSWTVDAAALQATFSFRTVVLINDFVAQALAAPRLGPEHLRPIGSSIKAQLGVIAVIGAGTGFGAAGLAPGPAGDAPIASEAGHAGFAPADEFELRLWERLKRRFGRVSIERVLSGRGLVAIYEAVRDQGAITQPAEVVAAARRGETEAQQALSRFVTIYGRVAGDLALTFGTRAGVYISGGIAPKILDWLERPAFREAFEDKGRLSGFVRSVPTFVVTHPAPGLLGAARCSKRRSRQPSMSRSSRAHGRARCSGADSSHQLWFWMSQLSSFAQRLCSRSIRLSIASQLRKRWSDPGPGDPAAGGWRTAVAAGTGRATADAPARSERRETAAAHAPPPPA